MGLLDKFKAVIKKISEGGPGFDPTLYDDKIALETSWSPLKGGGTNIGTHYFKEVSKYRIEFKAKKLGLIFPGIFMLVGLGVGIGMTIGGINDGDYTLLAFGIPFGSIFFAVGYFIFRAWTKPRVFDLELGYFWKGKRNIRYTSHIEGLKEYCLLKDIHALQIIREYCRGKENSYYSYELNLILKNSERLNVVDHGKIKLLREDAEKLSEFLKVPVWDSSL